MSMSTKTSVYNLIILRSLIKQGRMSIYNLAKTISRYRMQSVGCNDIRKNIIRMFDEGLINIVYSDENRRSKFLEITRKGRNECTILEKQFDEEFKFYVKLHTDILLDSQAK